jgi:hypothetical protein
MFSAKVLRFLCVGWRGAILHVPVVLMELGLNSTYYVALFSSVLKDTFSIYSKSSFFFSFPLSLDLGKRVRHFSSQFGLTYNVLAACLKEVGLAVTL